MSDSIMSKLKELKMDLEGKIDTTKDMIKATEAKLDSTLVKPIHAKLEKMDLKLDTADEKLASLNSTCLGFEHKLNVLKCIRQP